MRRPTKISNLAFILETILRKGSKIMPHCTRTKEDVAGRVEDMFRLAERDYYLDLKRLALLTGLDYSSLNNYRKGAAIPLHAFVQLAPHMPDELLSLCIGGVGKHIGTDEPDDGGAHDLARDSSEYNVEYINATDPRSDGGPKITPRERAKLGDIHRRMRARRVAS